SGCGSHRHIHRLASPPAAARTATFTDSPRLRLRLAPPHSQARLASGRGSHRHVHRLASPPAAARTATFTDSPRLRLRLAPPPSATLAHAVELQEVRRSRHPHGRAGDDDEDVARPDRPVAKERRPDLPDPLVRRLNLADEPRGHAPPQ